MLYERETWLLKEEDVFRLERIDERIVKWMHNDKTRISAEELRTRLKLKSTGECLQDRRPQKFGHLERID